MKYILTILILTSSFLVAQVQDHPGGYNGNSNSGTSYFNHGYYLEGRTLLNDPFRDSLAETPGRIILTITVDSSGKVIEVSGPARGSTTLDSMLMERSKAVAYKARFSPASLRRQQGMMSFRYYKK